MGNRCISHPLVSLLPWFLCFLGYLTAEQKWCYKEGPGPDLGNTCKAEKRAFDTFAHSKAQCAYRCGMHANCETIFYAPLSNTCHGCLGEFGNLTSDRELLSGSVPFSREPELVTKTSCYGDLTSYASSFEDSLMTPVLCSAECNTTTTFRPIALTGTTCYCDVEPLESYVTSGCDIPCSADTDQICGDEFYFSVTAFVRAC